LLRRPVAVGGRPRLLARPLEIFRGEYCCGFVLAKVAHQSGEGDPLTDSCTTGKAAIL
jgi:hypothetical protein